MSLTLIRNGTVVDPSKSIMERMDVLVDGKNIQDVASHISSINASSIVDAQGLFVIPGLVDLHTHISSSICPYLGLEPDKFCLIRGTTTAVDAGSTGELTFEAFRRFVMSVSHTSTFAFLNSESLGMIEYPPEESKQKWADLLTADNETYYPNFTNLGNIKRVIEANKGKIVGLKWAHHGRNSLKSTSDIGKKLGIRTMFENHHMPWGLRHLRGGDIITHLYHNFYNKLEERVDGILDEDGEIAEEFYKAKKAGVVFDVGHGGGSFSWEVAEKAFENDLLPDTISTDLWLNNVNGPVYDLLTTMDKFMLLGMSLEDTVKATTVKPASSIDSNAGTLNPGRLADIILIRNSECQNLLIDSYGKIRRASRKLTLIKVFKDGKIFK